MDDLGQLIIFFMCAAIFGMGSAYLFQLIKAEHRIELGDIVYIIQDGEIEPAKITMIRITEKYYDEIGTKAFWTELEASEHIN